MYKTYSYNNMPTPARRYEKEKKEEKREEHREDNMPCEQSSEKPCGKCGGILDSLETDDIILLVVALVLLMDDCDDKLLLLAIAFVFFSDWF